MNKNNDKLAVDTLALDNFISLDELTLSSITHNLSHDIGNPLTSIITYGSLIEQTQNLDIPKDKLASYAKSMLSETWKISILMEKFLLLISRKPNASSTKLKDLHVKIMSRYQSRYGLSAFDLELVGFESDAYIFGDIEQLCSMICEMLNNAASELKYLKSQGQEVDLHIQLNAEILSTNSQKPNSINFILKNPTAKHEITLCQMLTPGLTDHTSGKSSVGIGLPAIHNSAHRFNGTFSIAIEKNKELSTGLETLTFVSCLSLPLVEMA